MVSDFDDVPAARCAVDGNANGAQSGTRACTRPTKTEDKGNSDDMATSECENTQATDRDGHLVAHPTLRLQHTCTPCGGWASWTNRRSCMIHGSVMLDIWVIQTNIAFSRFSLSTS